MDKLEISIENLDIEGVKVALKNGANPNGKDPNESLLHQLAHEYIATKTTAGDIIIDVALLLINAGTNVNQIGYNNWRRAIDILLDSNASDFASILIKNGSTPQQREFI